MRIVVKIGSSSLVTDEARLDLAMLTGLANQICQLRNAGHDTIVVSSGAIATGLGVLGRAVRPKELPGLQAASAVGQGELYARWAAALAAGGQQAAQVLLTMHDVTFRASYVNARNTLDQLLGWGTVPVVNENDTTATDEITFGDNDTLAAQVAVLMKADLLVLLTDTDGLYTAHPDAPGAELIREVTDHSLLEAVDTAAPGSHWGSGGMGSKVIAAEMAVAAGTRVVIAGSHHPDVLAELAAGAPIGTLFSPTSARGSSFKLWLRYAKPARGQVQVDPGAVAALRDRGASLLPVGITAVDGDFMAGDALEVVCASEGVIAKGIASMSAHDLAAWIAARGNGAAAPVGEAIHRDQLVLT